jgi:hypothetical protein
MSLCAKPLIACCIRPEVVFGSCREGDTPSSGRDGNSGKRMATGKVNNVRSAAAVAVAVRIEAWQSRSTASMNTSDPRGSRAAAWRAQSSTSRVCAARCRCSAYVSASGRAVAAPVPAVGRPSVAMAGESGILPPFRPYCCRQTTNRQGGGGALGGRPSPRCGEVEIREQREQIGFTDRS